MSTVHDRLYIIARIYTFCINTSSTIFRTMSVKSRINTTNGLLTGKRKSRTPFDRATDKSILKRTALRAPSSRVRGGTTTVGGVGHNFYRTLQARFFCAHAPPSQKNARLMSKRAENGRSVVRATDTYSAAATSMPQPSSHPPSMILSALCSARAEDGRGVSYDLQFLRAPISVVSSQRAENGRSVIYAASTRSTRSPKYHNHLRTLQTQSYAPTPKSVRKT